MLAAVPKFPPGTKLVDTSKRVTRDQARACVLAKYLGIFRTVLHTVKFQGDNLDAAEREALEDEGLTVLGVYNEFRTTGWSEETGRADAREMIAAAKAAGLRPGRAVILDCEAIGPVDWKGYARGFVLEARALASGYRLGCYDGLGFATALTSAEKDALGFDFFWNARAAHSQPPSMGYALVQGVTFAAFGNEFDADEVVDDLSDWLAGPDVSEGGPRGASALDPSPGMGSEKPGATSLAFRAVVDGERRVDRVVRIAYHVATLDGDLSRATWNNPAGSRALLEPGARLVPWTCLMTLRAVLYHACLRPEDGWPIITVAGETFGGDYTPKLGSDFETRILTRWGEYFGGTPGVGKRGAPWPMERGVVFCRGGTHVGLVCFVDEIEPGVYRALTVEGGQADGPVPAATESWSLAYVDGQAATPPLPVTYEVNDHRLDDHAQCFVRTFRRATAGTIEGLYGVARMGNWALYEPDQPTRPEWVMKPKMPAPVLSMPAPPSAPLPLPKTTAAPPTIGPPMLRKGTSLLQAGGVAVLSYLVHHPAALYVGAAILAVELLELVLVGGWFLFRKVRRHV